MKKNILPIILLVFLLARNALCAATIDEIMEGAKANSPSYQNYILTYQNGLLSVEELEEKDKIVFNVDATLDPLADYGTDSYGMAFTPSLSVRFPNDGNTTISGESTLATQYKTGDTTVSGNVSVTHSFDFSPYDSDYADDLKYAITKYDTELVYRESELTFRKSVLNTVGQIISLESSILQSEFNADKQQKAMDKLIALGTYSENSATYINTQNVLTSYLESLEAVREQYNNLLAYYRNLTGLEWNGIDVPDLPSLVLRTLSDGNTSVKIKSLNYESTYENYKKALADANPSSLSAKLALGASTEKNYTLSGSLAYNSRNWNVSVTPGLFIYQDGTRTPVVTVAGHWDNETYSTSRSVNTALNNAKIAENSYLDALSTYNQDASSYSLKILEWKNKKVKTEAEREYQKTLLENEKTLYELGLATKESLRAAEISYEIAQNEWKQLVIEGLALQCDLDIFAL